MATTIAGGAYLAADQKTWINAAGEPLSKEQESAAKKLHAEQADANEQTEAALQMRDALKRNVIVMQAPAAKAPAAKG